MAQARSAVAAASTRVHVIAPAELGATAIAALRARHIEARAVTAPVGSDEIIAWALEAAPTTAAAVELAPACERAARAQRPVCLLAPTPSGSGRAAIERVAALAYLRAHGAAVAHDVDAWLEAVVLLVRFGLPTGPRAAVIAPSGSWLEAQATAIAGEAELAGTRSPLVQPDDPTDVVLYDPVLGPPQRASSGLPGMYVPVAARGELATDPAMLHGARAALGAVALLGRAAERIAIGLGPAARTATAELAIDRERLDRQTGKLDVFRAWGRIGDHETKTLLAAYGVPITRQALAGTPSAAIKLARRAGFPVEVKPWGPDIAAEPGCPIESATSDAQVRSAFTAVLGAAGKLNATETTVIVRETPPPGREVSVQLLELPSVGWTVILDAPGAPQLAAAPAPLRLVDAQALAAHLVASRAGDPELDRSGLANVLRRASHLVVDLERQVAKLALPRVIVGGRGARTLVVDAYAELR